ncbi:hypothetical protein PYCCODRAFT_1423843 [Trametes coccinea BRFM310]|uniref:Uncharacterized protein n=1 Tax=Trametes coccinea (strain BRFM310) TaxID=1353009 RepID=A0A1Y2IUR1_TRAC3|nr:hypothetical protein PYCCODRAFT_1423843 [Trametes coccinea BRFM310]
MLPIVMDKRVWPSDLIFLANDDAPSKNRWRAADAHISLGNSPLWDMVTLSAQMTNNHTTSEMWKHSEDVGDCAIKVVIAEQGDRCSILKGGEDGRARASCVGKPSCQERGCIGGIHGLIACSIEIGSHGSQALNECLVLIRWKEIASSVADLSPKSGIDPPHELGVCQSQIVQSFVHVLSMDVEQKSQRARPQGIRTLGRIGLSPSDVQLRRRKAPLGAEDSWGPSRPWHCSHQQIEQLGTEPYSAR